jgi:hypothetical protein
MNNKFLLIEQALEPSSTTPSNHDFPQSYVPEDCGECDEDHKDQLPGGLADDMSPSDFDPEELAKGVEVEAEHTGDRDLAREIAMDHLAEIPDYYTRLNQMEDEAKGVSEQSIEWNYGPAPGVVGGGLETDDAPHDRYLPETPEHWSKKGIHNIEDRTYDDLDELAGDMEW